MEFQSLAIEIHENAKNHGWWDNERSIPELLCLIHSEVSEALEAYRNADNDNFKEELADIIIRVFDLAIAQNINIQEEVIKKHTKNIDRPYRHGGKVC